MAHLFTSLVGSLSCQEKDRVFTHMSWFDTLKAFDSKALAALNREELKSIEEEKQIFLNEIGYEQNTLSNMIIIGNQFKTRIQDQTTEEGLRFVLEEMVNKFLIENPNFRMDVLQTALDKYILEKNKQKYTSPAA